MSPRAMADSILKLSSVCAWLAVTAAVSCLMAAAVGPGICTCWPPEICTGATAPPDSLEPDRLVAVWE